MTLLRPAGALIAVLLSATACSGTDDAGPEPDVARTDPARKIDTTPDPTEDPVQYFSRGRACMQAAGSTVIWEQIQVDRPLTLAAFEPIDAVGGLEVDATSVVAIPTGEVPLTGSVRGARIPQKWAAEVGWDDREPIDGAEIQPGDYYVFLEGRIPGPGSDDGVELRWTDESGTTGASVWPVKNIYRKKC